MEGLMKNFLRHHIVEQTGHGAPKVVREYGAKAYGFGTSAITATVPFDRSGFEGKRENATVNATVKLSETEKSHPPLDSQDNAIAIEGFSEKIGKHRQRSFAHLANREKKGWLREWVPTKQGTGRLRDDVSGQASFSGRFLRVVWNLSHKDNALKRPNMANYSRKISG